MDGQVAEEVAAGVSVEPAPSPWRLVWITAVITTGATAPVMLYIAPVAGLVSALPATLVGVPLAVVARRWRFNRAWQAAALGLCAAMLAGGLAGWVFGVTAFTDQPAPRGYVASMIWQCAAVAAPFGPAAALVYWARWVSTGAWSRRSVSIGVVLTLLTAIIFAANHELR